MRQVFALFATVLVLFIFMITTLPPESTGFQRQVSILYDRLDKEMADTTRTTLFIMAIFTFLIIGSWSMRYLRKAKEGKFENEWT